MTEQISELPAKQQPTWDEHPDYLDVVHELGRREPLVEPTAIDALTTQLARVSRGEAFLLQGGPCAESFSDTPEDIKNLLKTFFAMSLVIMYGAGVNVVKVARVGGQFGKPRSSDTEVIEGTTLPSFRGEIVNGAEATEKARQHDPNRILLAYDHSLRTIHDIERLSKGGFASIEQMHAWGVAFAEQSQQRERYTAITDGIDQAIKFMKASGATSEHLRSLHEADVFTSHEALVRDYEDSLTRLHDGRLYDTSAHMLWIGERTRGLDDYHVRKLASVANPVGSKLGPTVTPQEVLDLCSVLNPDNIPGKLTLITRLGKDAVREVLPPILRAVSKRGLNVVWSSDPMHGNTSTHTDGRKTRHFEHVAGEIEETFAVHGEEGTNFGGVHLEMTGDNVTECMGGSGRNEVTSLDEQYTTACDPRLNADQSLEVAFRVSELLADGTKA